MSAPLDILALTQRRPFPPDRGDRIRSFHLLTRLAREHRVWALSLDDSPLDDGGELEFPCHEQCVVHTTPARRMWGAAQSLFRNEPLTLGWYHHPRIVAQIREWSQRIEFDAAYVFSSSMAPYWVSEHARTGLPGVMDFVDVDSEKWRQYAASSSWPRRWIYRREHARLGDYEKELVRRAHRCVLVSQAECDLFRSLVPGADTVAIGNGVDGEYFARPQLSRRADPPRVVFVGQMDYHANVDAVLWFAHEVLPLLRAWREDIEFEVVGAHPAPEIRGLERFGGVSVTGWVEDIRPHLWGASVAIAPLRIAQGTQNKVLEAMAASVPVVASPLASRGLAESSGPHLLVAESPDEFAQAIRAILDEPARAGALIQAALDFLARDHSWDVEAGQLSELLRDAARGRG